MKRFGWIVALIAATTDTVALASTCPAFVWLGEDAKARDTFFFRLSGTCESIEIDAIEVAPVDRRNEEERTWRISVDRFTKRSKPSKP